MKTSNRAILVFLLLGVFWASCRQTTYYVSLSGNDADAGTKQHPWKTLNREVLLRLQPGDTLFFKAGETFDTGFLIDSLFVGTEEKPIVITSDADNPAKIRSGNQYGLRISNSAYLKIEHLVFAGSGRKNGNTHPGVFISNCRNIAVNRLEIEGYQKSGLQIHASSNIVAENVYAHDNGFAGIFISGESGRKNAAKNILIRDCKAENNPGDPAEQNNHSGNGILVGHSTNVCVEYCTATENGWDMPRQGNGPVGIWAYESDSVMIQYCIAYRNKTQKSAEDGGGFDLDGGMTNSIIQNCLSYENDGSGFGLFQYAGASPWYNNIVRYCISENDGNISAARAGVYVWNASDDPGQFKNAYFHNNIIYNERGAAVSYAARSANSGFRFFNNVFAAQDSPIIGNDSTGIYEDNSWYSFSSSKQSMKGKNNPVPTGHFNYQRKTNLTDPHQLVAGE